VAGEQPAEAIRAARALNEVGIQATLDLLGEDVTDPREAEASRRAYVALLRAIADAQVESGISIKLTMIGLDVDRGTARDHLVSILDTARETDNFVRIDMEGSRVTQATLDVFREVFSTYRNVGVVIQSMLRRSAADVEDMIRLRASVRLVKGAYQEPDEIAFPDKRDVNESFDRLTELLLAEGVSPAIATHDDERIEHAIAFAAERGIAPERFEFQMLYGIRRETQVALVERGYRMRVYVPFGREWFPYFTRRLRERKENVSFVLRNLVRR
jgi:proline dehydrogenase